MSFSVVSLTVDGKTSANSILPETLMISGTLFVGGISNKSLPVAEVFRGCIDSLAINGRYAHIVCISHY